MAHSSAKGKLIAVIGDEDTCVGFLLGEKIKCVKIKVSLSHVCVILQVELVN